MNTPDKARRVAVALDQVRHHYSGQPDSSSVVYHEDTGRYRTTIVCSGATRYYDTNFTIDVWETDKEGTRL